MFNWLRRKPRLPPGTIKPCFPAFVEMKALVKERWPDLWAEVVRLPISQGMARLHQAFGVPMTNQFSVNCRLILWAVQDGGRRHDH